MADPKKLELVENKVRRGAVAVYPEPRRWEYPHAYEAQADPRGNYYAVYGNWQEIDALERAGCIARSAGARVDTDVISKAYLNLDMGADQLQPLAGAHPNGSFLFGVAPDADHAIGLYHTGYPVEGDAKDSLSYLVLSAEEAAPFRKTVERLTTEASPFAQMRHIGRATGEFVLIPVRRSLGEAIRRAHPNLIEIEGDDVTRAPVSVRSMQEILARLHEDSRFAVVGPTRPAEVEPLAPQPEPAQEVSVKKPLKELLAELAPHVQRFERHEQIGGGFSTRLVLAADPAVQGIVEQINAARGQLHIPPVVIDRRNTTGTVSVSIGEPAYAILKPSWPTVAENGSVQSLRTELLGRRDLQVGALPAPKTSMRIDRLRLVHTADHGSIHDWLIIRAPHLLRARLLARDLGIGGQHWKDLTDENTVPALLRVPLSATVAASLLAQKNLALLEHEETPAPDLEALDTAQLAWSPRRNLKPEAAATNAASVLAAQGSKQGKGPVLPNAVTTRAAAEKLLFADTIARRWICYLPEDHPQSPVWVLALKVDDWQLTAFKKGMAKSNFTKLPGRTLKLVDEAREKGGRKYFYTLTFQPEDIAALAPQMKNDKRWPASSAIRLLNDDALVRRVKYELGEKEVAADPVKAAWGHLAAQCSNGNVSLLTVRYEAADIEAMEKMLNEELDTLSRSIADGAEVTARIAGDWKEKFPVLLESGIEAQVRGLNESVHGSARGLKSVEEKIRELKPHLAEYVAWLKEQPKSKDGSVTLAHLVFRTRDTTVGHLQQLRGEKGPNGNPLFPRNGIEIDLPTDENAPPGAPTTLTMLPVGPEFRDYFRLSHEVKIKNISKRPLLMHELRPFVHERFGPKKQEEDPFNNVVKVNFERRANEEAARSRLLQTHIPRCESLLLFSHLREEHGFENIGDIERKKIGVQPGVLLHIGSRSDWTQKLHGMLQEMQRANILAPRQYYRDAPQLIGMHKLETQLEQLEQGRNLLSESLIHLQHIGDGRGDDFHQAKVREDAARIFTAMEAGEFPRAAQLHAILKVITHTPGHIPESMGRHALAIAQEAEQNMSRQIEEIRVAKDRAEIQVHDLRQQLMEEGLIQQDPQPLFYLKGEEKGITLEELDAKVQRHFGGHDRSPLQVAGYLGLDKEKQHGTYSDENILARLKECGPGMTPRRGEQSPRGGFTARLIRQQDRPEITTLAEHFATAERLFTPGPARVG